MTDPRSPLDWNRVHPSFEPTYQRFPSRRSSVMGTKGMVACSQPLAASAGIEILNKGGNAAEAAVAVAAALNVTEPCNTGIGGDAFCLFYDAKEKRVRALNGSGRAPQGLTLEKLRSKGINGREIPLADLNSVTVPGAASAWVDAIELFGSGKQDITLSEVLAPAIRLAENGYPVHELTASLWEQSEGLIKRASPNAHEMLKDGSAPKAGEMMRMPELARTFRELATKGRDGFYKGRVAEEIVKLVKSKGGHMELSDLAAHGEKGSEEVTPISYTYHPAGDGTGKEPGVTVYECPPNGQGLTALLALGILDELQETGKVRDLAKVEHNSAEYLHALIEALRIAFADTRYFVSDPSHGSIPVKALLSKEYLKERAKVFDPTKATADVRRGTPANTCDTVYFTVSDAEGNACSFINSNYAGFGTGAVPAGCGFTLQNRGSGFVLEEGHPNCLAGGKRPYHTIIPAMALKGDELFLSYGVMGGFMQPQGHVQVLMNMLHRGFTAQAALDAPRFCISAGMPDASKDGKETSGDINSDVFLEEGISEETRATLEGMGHSVKLMGGFERFMFGRGQIIQQLSDPKNGKRVWAAGSDPRADGQAVAQV